MNRKALKPFFRHGTGIDRLSVFKSRFWDPSQ